MSQLNRRHFLMGSAAVTAAAPVLAGPATNLAVGGITPPRYGPPPGIAKLNANENPYGPSPAALRAMADASRQGAYYVGESVTRLRAMIAEKHGLTSDQILFSSGSSGALTYLAVEALQRGKIVAPDLYWDTTTRMGMRQTGGEMIRLAKDPNLAIDLKAMAAAVADDVSMVHVTNPNNPTGLTLPPTALSTFCKRVSQQATVLVDEAYNELTDDPDGNTMIPLIKQGYDVLVARTFSKIYGLAGMRVGYLIGTPERIAQIRTYSLGDYALNQAGLAGAVASYGDEDFLHFSKANILAGREMIAEALAVNGVRVLPSSTNFMFVDLGHGNAESFRQAMASRGVLIRGIYRDYTAWSRVSMGLLEDVAKYVEALPAALDEINYG